MMRYVCVSLENVCVVKLICVWNSFACVGRNIYIYIYIYIYAGPDLRICTICDVSIIYRNMNMCDNQMMYTCIPYKYKNTYVVK
jgi:hypothetical protein